MRVRQDRSEYEVVRSTLEEAVEALPSRSFLISDANVWARWGESAGSLPVRVLDPGEGSKSLGVYEKTLAWLASQGAGRNSTVVALGGGVVGDLAGFVAATYMRGVRFIQIPTTLLAQVDASIGGKVGVNLPHGKNLVGAFYPPEIVYLCHETLATLPEREWRAGTAEIVKMAAICDADLFSGLEMRPLTNDEHLQVIVDRCIAHKARVVESDPYERSGARATLNFGHTVGHALEKLGGYQSLLHGEAVAIGMVVEARLGGILGLTPEGVSERIRDLLIRQGFMVELPGDTGPDDLVEAMALDKKATVDGLSFSLLEAVGRCKLVHGVSEEAVLSSLRKSK